MKIRKKYRFDILVLNIKEEISYTEIPLINTYLYDFYILSKMFHGKIVNKALKLHYTFVTPMEYTGRLYTLATTIPLVTSPENSSKEGTKYPTNVKSGKQHLGGFICVDTLRRR